MSCDVTGFARRTQRPLSFERPLYSLFTRHLNLEKNGRNPEGGGGVLPQILDGNVPRRFLNPNPI